ncbi:MAG: hypothetical protein FGM33_00575 [Candidatus Kapabacteria bacterium]|nr:hypothetical protein [Candidatus Kapabacteria bacterium]
MSNLFSAEPEPEYEPESTASEQLQPAAPAGAAAAEVELALRKFWDVVRSSAETIVTLRQEVLTLRKQNEALSRQPAADEHLQVRVNELEEALSTAEEMSRLLEADVANSMRRISELEAELDDLAAAKEKLRQEAYESVARLEIESDVQGQQKSSLEQELAGMNLRVAQLEALLDEKNEQLQATTEISLKHEILEREKDELGQRVDRLNQRLADLEGIIDEKTQRIDSLSVDLSAARRDVVEFELQLSARDAEVQDLLDQLARQRQRAEELEESLAAQAVSIEAAEPPSEIIDADVDSGWHEQREQLAAEVADLQGQLQRALAIIETYRSAGLRHIEDPNRRNQMALFAMEPEQLQPAASDPVPPPAISLDPGSVIMSEQELLAIAGRLDELAGRVEELLGIS